MISHQIKTELQEVDKKVLEHNPSYAPTHTTLVELIDLYDNSKFKGSDRDSEGFKKWFFNILSWRRKVESKAIDLDVKDLRLNPTDVSSTQGAWFLANELKMYLKEYNWSKKLNQIKDRLPKWGSVVLKKVGDEIHFVCLKNFFPDPEADNLKSARYIIEKHRYAPAEFMDLAKKKGWDQDKVDKILEIHTNEKKIDPEIILYERYGLYDGKKMKHLVGFREDQHKTSEEVVLLEEEQKELPYKELHREKLEGRWLGRGLIEEGFEEQIAMNETVNYERKGLHWSSKKLFHTRSDDVASNLLSGAKNGQVIKSNDEINPIATEERNLPAYREQKEYWEQNADRKSFTYDAVRGERLPAGTPLGSARIQTAMASSYFETIREDFGIFLKEVLYDWIIPTFKQKYNKKHLMNFMGNADDVEKFDKMVAETRTKEAVAEFIGENDHFPSKDQFAMIEAAEKEQMSSDRWIEIPDRFYENIRYKVDFRITGESADIQTRLSTLWTLLTTIAPNPQYRKDPFARKLLIKAIEEAGFSPEEFALSEGEAQNLEQVASKQTTEVGGSVPRPATPSQGGAPAGATGGGAAGGGGL